jgi:NAD(P)-dependent dehydrogenase (short-subunit alcohol dehydrogenase family)
MPSDTEAPRTVLVTGATDGLGYETARLLAETDHEVIVHGRTAGQADDAVERLVKDGVDPLRLYPASADFASFTEVATMAHLVSSAHPRLDVLVNNAAIAGPKEQQLTEDGYERTWQINYLSPYLLTTMLERRLAATPRSRVVNVSSSHHVWASLEATELKEMHRYSSHAAYSRSKLALTMFTKALTLHGSARSTAISVHPGILDTALLPVYSDTGRPAIEGARVVARLCTRQKVFNGAYYNQEAVPAHASACVENLAAVQRLWQVSANLTGMG